MKKDVEKLAFIFKYLDAMYYFKDEDINDHSKRVILRYFFILIDDLLKLAGKAKNGLFRESKISRESKLEIESAIKKLEHTYNYNYDIIRDKFSAHQQQLSLLDLQGWWNEIDYTTIESIYSEAHEIRNLMITSGNDFFTPLTQYSKLDIYIPQLLPKDEEYYVSSDRFASLKENTVSMIPLHKSQEKAQIILGIIELLENDFAITLQTEACKTDYEKLLFDVGWFLVICDVCSLIGNLYEDNQYDQSLLTYWKDDINGYSLLENFNQARNTILEGALHQIRNQIAAHKDSQKSISDVYTDFLDLDFKLLDDYAITYCNAFLDACRMDFKTKQFLTRNQKLDGVLGLSYRTDREFDK